MTPTGHTQEVTKDAGKKRRRDLFSAKNLAIFAFFALLLAAGLFIYQDYGLTWDDLAQVEIGELNYRYVFQGDPALLTLKNRYYGPLFEVILYAVTQGLPERQLFLARHLLTFLAFYGGVFFFYLLAKRMTRSWIIGLLACALLAATPRIFAHSFYNSKDIPFLAAFIAAVYTLVVYLDEKSIRNAGFHALASAIVIALRAPGILIFALTIGFLLLDLFFQPQPGQQRRWILSGLFYAALTTALGILFWPVLWHNPPVEWINAIKQMSQFPWEGGVVLYRGRFVEANALPWHYIPIWMLITIPLPFLALSAAGGISSGISFLRKPEKINAPEKRNFLILASWLLIPILAVILLHSVLYDEWRQMIFVYPALVLFAAQGVQAIAGLRIPRLSPRWLQVTATLIAIAALVEPLSFILRYHPHENVYFNRLGGYDMARVKRHYELDYWGLSYKQGLETILENDPSEKIRVHVFNRPGRINALILPEKQRQRLVYVDNPEQADYFLTNYRWHPEPYDYPDEVYAIRVGNASIFSVFKMHP